MIANFGIELNSKEKSTILLLPICNVRTIYHEYHSLPSCNKLIQSLLREFIKSFPQMRQLILINDAEHDTNSRDYRYHQESMVE